MKKTVIVCGLIAGLISASMFIALILLGKAGDMNFENGMIYGFSLMILAFSLIFVGTKSVRDQNGGNISFGKAFMVGLYISLIASSVYVLVWMIDLNLFIPDFADKYGSHMMEQLKKEGASTAALAAKSAEIAEFKKMYDSPVFIVLMTYVEILPVGILISLISAFIMKRKQKA
jgi:Protein of unknown function (DUF4199)